MHMNTPSLATTTTHCSVMSLDASIRSQVSDRLTQALADVANFPQ
jgi:hypothetical protein